jgi:hypothetical protein
MPCTLSRISVQAEGPHSLPPRRITGSPELGSDLFQRLAVTVRHGREDNLNPSRVVTFRIAWTTMTIDPNL